MSVCLVGYMIAVAGVGDVVNGNLGSGMQGIATPLPWGSEAACRVS